MQKRPERITGSCSREARLTQNSSEGGVIDTDVTEVTVMPWRLPSCMVEITLTALVSRRMAFRKLPPRSCGMSSETAFIGVLP